MANMELVRKDTLKGVWGEKEEMTLETYQSGRYIVRVLVRNSNGKVEDVNISYDLSFEYMPDIYERENERFERTGFEISTTSYGSLPPEEIAKVIDGYQEAMGLAELLTEKYVGR